MSNIVRMLSKELLKPVLIASLIAVPAGWWIMNEWLQNFAYRIRIDWTVFLIAGVLAILIAIVTVGYQAVKAAAANPVKNLRNE